MSDLLINGNGDPLDEEVVATGVRTSRLPRMTVKFLRIPLLWIADERLFSPNSRLFLLLLHESRWGQRQVILTTAKAAMAKVSSRHKLRCLRQLEEAGLVRIDQVGHASAIVTVLLPPAR